MHSLETADSLVGPAIAVTILRAIQSCTCGVQCVNCVRHRGLTAQSSSRKGLGLKALRLGSKDSNGYRGEQGPR
jgi:hypothetical protein